MADENPIWGQERIANELLIKLAIRVCRHGRFASTAPSDHAADRVVICAGQPS
jgi:hypothetical protein